MCGSQTLSTAWPQAWNSLNGPTIPRVRLLADLYHMMMDSEPLENITTCAQWLDHIHVADTDRGAPGSGSYPYEELFRRLHESGYNGRISIECRWDDFTAQAAESLTFLQHMWAETQ